MAIYISIIRWLEDKVRASLDRMGVTLVRVLNEVNMAQVLVVIIVVIFFVVVVKREQFNHWVLKINFL